MSGKKLYHALGKKIDGLPMRAPWNEAFYKLLKDLYSPEDADLVIRMPYGLSTFQQVRAATGYGETKLRGRLEQLASKGLVFDIQINGQEWYQVSPIVVGIFEMTMMRTGPNVDYKTWAGLFRQYLDDDAVFHKANYGHGQQNSYMRALAHDEAVKEPDFVEILDYESAGAIVEKWDKFAVGLCSCRHEKLHSGEKECMVPLEMCSSFGYAADYLVRHGMAKEVSRSEMLENLTRAKDMKLVLSADNVKRRPTFICQCCGCCCIQMVGIKKYGFSHALVTSSYISSVDEHKCSGCGLCSKGCPIAAVKMDPGERDAAGVQARPKIDESMCLGCGVCALWCNRQAIKLVKRGKRVICPETTFERIILQSLDRGTLQNQLFGNPGSMSHKTMRGILGGFLRLSPVKRALMSDQLRSRFLASMHAAASRQIGTVIDRI